MDSEDDGGDGEYDGHELSEDDCCDDCVSVDEDDDDDDGDGVDDGGYGIMMCCFDWRLASSAKLAASPTASASE